MPWFRARLRVAADDGFSLVEAVVALSLAAVVLSSFSMALIGGLKASVIARQNQQAADQLNQAVEVVRSLPYSLVAMDPADVTGTDGGRVVTCGATKCLHPTTGADEPLQLAAGGAVSPHITVTSHNKVNYTVSRYVSKPTDSEAGATYKKLTVFVTWTSAQTVRTRQISTLVSDTRRGLPLPDYKFAPVGPASVTVNPGAEAVFGFKLTNNGARDTWNISTDQSTLGWTYLLDNGDNIYNAATDTTLLTDTTSEGVVDTAAVEPTVSLVFWVKRTVPTTPNTAYSSVAHFTATSFAVPSYATTLTTTVNVVVGVVSPTSSPTPSASASALPTVMPPVGTCLPQASVPTPSGVTQTLFSLFNTANTQTNTVARNPLVMNPDSTPTDSSMYQYSTDDGTTSSQIQAGRILRPSTLGGAETDVFRVADFRYRMTANRTISGTMTFSIWVVPQSGISTDPVNLGFYFKTGEKSTAGDYVWTQQASTTHTAASWGCITFRKLTVSMPITSLALKNNDYVDVLVTNNGSNNIRLGYGTTNYNANMVLALK